jgi:lysozyme
VELRDASRGRWILGFLAVGIPVLAVLLWFVWLPHYRPTLRAGEWYGIDVSHHQGPIDWMRVAADDISFAYIKATEGGDFTDDRFEENWSGSAEAGLARGAYHFFTLCTSGEAQASHFLLTVPRDAEALPPAVDLELAGNCKERPSANAVRSELESFLHLVESETGQTVLLYLGDEFERRYPVRESLRRPIWQLRFLRRPDGPGWQIWQVGGFAHVDGIDGKVDLNVMRND